MTSKKIVVFGGTGPTGLLFCKEALEHGHELTIYARNPDKLTEDIKSHAKANIIKGTLEDSALISSSIANQDAVISVLGPSSFYTPSGTFTNAYRLIFAAMRAHSVKRIFALGTFSVTDPKDKPPLSIRLAVWLVWMIVHSAWREIVAVGKLFDEEAQGLDWTVYRVGGLGNGPKGNVIATYVGAPRSIGSVERADIAKWLVQQVELPEPQYVREKPYLCSPEMKWW